MVEEYRWAARQTKRPVKAVLTGPYTLARLSELEEGVQLETAVNELAEALRAEVAELVGEGARRIQIDEPALLQHPGDEALGRRAMQHIAGAKGGAELALALYFGDAAPLFPALLAWPVDSLVLDFTYSPRLPQVVAGAACDKAIGFGLLDGRNTRLEEPKAVLPQLEKMLGRCSAKRAYLTTSCGLEYLPRDRARLKLRHLTTLKQAFLGVQA